MVIYVDNAAWVALLHQNDHYHMKATAVLAQLKSERHSLVTSDFVLIELANYFAAGRYRQNVIQFIRGLRSRSEVRIVPLSLQLLEDGWELYSRYQDKEWGLTDCISFAIMQKEGITTAFTSDHHFRQMGFQTLL